VKAAFKQALVPTLQEPGCEALFEASREGGPHKLVFFEVFSSLAAHEFHLEQDYTKKMFTALEQVGWSACHDQIECTLATSASVQTFRNFVWLKTARKESAS